MQSFFFNVAGHGFAIDADTDITGMLPGLKPFISEHEESLLFRIIIDNTIVPSWEGRRIGTFPCPSASFEVYRLDNGAYRILVSDESDTPCVFISSDAEQKVFTITTNGNEKNVTFGINNSLMVIYTVCSAAHKTLLVHSSVVENKGRAYMFLGTSGSGKSTHSDLWTTHIEGSTLINDDNPVIRISPDGTPTVYGSPWSGKRPIYKNLHYPIGGMATIVQAKENRAVKESIPSAFGILLSSCSTFKFDKKIHMNICSTISSILERVPVHTLFCRPDEEATKVSSSAFGL